MNSSSHGKAAIQRLAAVLLVVSWPATAIAKDEGFYLGASVGLSSVEQRISLPGPGDARISDETFAYKLFGGYQFSPWLSLEAGYRDLGSPSSGPARTSLSAIDAAGVLGLPLGPIRAFAKLGGAWGSSETRLGSTYRRSDSEFALLGGAGVDIELGSVALRGELEYLDMLDDVWLFSVGLTFTF